MKIELIFPVLNESKTLEAQINKVKHHISKIDAYDFLITIVDNGSTDQTKVISNKLIKQKMVNKYLYLPQKGRGRAIKLAISKSNADIVSYMDIDLSTDLNSLLPLIESITKENHDIAIGSRLSKGSNVIGRKKIREFTSRSYNLLIKFFFPFSRIDDMQCGFKAISREKAQILLPLVKNNFWFFDTELLLLSRKLNLQIKQLPVKWIDDPSSSVNILKTAIEDLIGLIRIRINIK